MNSSSSPAWAPRVAPPIGTAAFFSNPHPTWAELLADGGVGYSATERTWLVARYDDAVSVLKDARLSKQTGSNDPSPLSASMLFQDPPAQARLRAAVQGWFTAARVREMESRIAEITDQLIDRMSQFREADFMAAFAVRLPLAVMAELLGVPETDWDILHGWSRTLSRTGETPEFRQAQGAAIVGMSGYFESLIDRRSGGLGTDLVSMLLAGQRAPEGLSRREILGTCMLLLIAGHETTVNLLGNGLAILLEHPEQYALLRADPTLLPSAIEEILRYESPVQRGTFRFAAEPIEIRGHTIARGEAVAVVIGAANRDPLVFPDPHRFDMFRSPNRHIAFGIGPHACLGAHLARAEARIGFTRLFDRLGEMRLAASPQGGLGNRIVRWLVRPSPAPLRWQQSTMVRGLDTLVVRW